MANKQISARALLCLKLIILRRNFLFYSLIALGGTDRSTAVL